MEPITNLQSLSRLSLQAVQNYGDGNMPLTRDRAIQLASAEFHKRRISVSPRWQIETFEDVHMPELHPEVPLYVVEFYDPSLSLKYLLYIIKFHRYTWELDGFNKIDLPESLQVYAHTFHD